MPRPIPVRRRFEELHPRDRNVKINRKARIEANWSCGVQDCIPTKIRPRVELKKGAKIRVGDIAGVEEIWWNWSVEVLRSLEELSTMMAGRLKVARELMVIEVQNRQEDPKNPQRKVAELLLGDVQRIVDKVKRHQADEVAKTGAQQQDIDMETFQELDREPGPASVQKEAKEQAQAHSPEFIEDDSPFDNVSSPTPASTHNGNGTSQRNKLPNITRINLSSGPLGPLGARKQMSIVQLNASQRLEVGEMRTRAVRLRAAAMRLEAEAFEIESDMAIAKKALNKDRALDFEAGEEEQATGV